MKGLFKIITHLSLRAEVEAISNDEIATPSAFGGLLAMTLKYIWILN
jgi:hypothetical protein